MTGFLLAGVGHVDLRRNSNYLIVGESEFGVETRGLGEPAAAVGAPAAAANGTGNGTGNGSGNEGTH